ncbi:uncharacterized protein LOC134931411 [Pseudophryne corroboree]|uniref:uncharacterized protein LOC134931411 n=1 Tax=Pseudophryne corroboree TaxID=495146 RepID=UPI0030817711
MMAHWCLLIIRYAVHFYLYKRGKNQKNQQPKVADEGQVQKPNAVYQAVTNADFLLGFFSELAAAVISWRGHFIPCSWCYIPAVLFTCLMACRIPYCLERLDKNVISCITYSCNLITQVSDFLLIPAFCFYIIYVLSNSGPCGLGVWGRVRWGLVVLIYGLVWLMLSGISYKYITRKEEGNPTVVPGDPENVEPRPVETPSENPRRPRDDSDCGGPLDTEGDPQERCSMIPESNEMFYDRDRVANG